MKRGSIAAVTLAVVVWCRSGWAADGDSTSFALIVGVNQSPDAGTAPLRYADDDAARYRDFFRAIGARTWVLATLDENTKRLHPEAAAEAVPPRLDSLRASVAALKAAVKKAQRAGYLTTLYVFYAGHGNSDGRSGYITLEDGRLAGPDLATEIFDRVKADRNHLVVDACSSYLLVLGRGEGGERRPFSGFGPIAGTIFNRRDIGLLLSTSSARDSHEWAAFQAGVFSHEVRSGMFGAADADGNGIVSYAEVAAFITRANESIANERYRPELFWRPPSGSTALVDLRSAMARRVEIPASEPGHYFLETPQGVRLADFHNGPSMAVRLLRPTDAHRLYLHRAKDHREFVLPGAAPVLSTASLSPQDSRVATRSAAHEAFSALFLLPLERTAVNALRAPALEAYEPAVAAAGDARRAWGWTLVGVSGLAAAGGAWALLSAQSLRDDISPAASQASTDDANGQIRTRNTIGAAALGLAGAAGLVGVGLLLWPDAPPLTATASRDAMTVGWRGQF